MFVWRSHGSVRGTFYDNYFCLFSENQIKHKELCTGNHDDKDHRHNPFSDDGSDVTVATHGRQQLSQGYVEVQWRHRIVALRQKLLIMSRKGIT